MSPAVAGHAVFERTGYRRFVPRVARLKGRVLVTRAGIVLDPAWLPRSIYWHEWVVAKTAALTAASLARRGCELVASDVPLAVIHSLWTAGHYHWLTESLPRALVVRRAFPDCEPILPKDHYSAYAPSLGAIGFKKVHWFPEGRNALIDRPVVSECTRRFGTTDPALLREVRETVICHYFPSGAPVAERLVYVSRAKARGRRVCNEGEVVAMLREFGAQVVSFEDLDFEGQVSLMAKTRLLVSIHGAGLANMMWMPSGGAVIELLARRNGLFDWNTVRRSFRHDACYLRLAEAMGHRHSALLGKSQHGRFEGTWNADLMIDVDALLTAVAASLE